MGSSLDSLDRLASDTLTIAWSVVRQSVACNDSSYRRHFHLWGLILVTRLPSQRGPQRNLTPEQRREAD
jgi:hypothetical protein